jgi:hypothetical protein
MSIVHAGQDWYGYGWEIQLLETGFLAIFLVPLVDARPFPRRAPPIALIWLLPLARVPDHARRRADQDPRRFRAGRISPRSTTTSRRSRSRIR